MKAADTAMYDAKAAGRSRVSLFRPEMAAAVEQKVMNERALREALAKGQFELAFQPQVCARTGAVIADEALLRWNQPTEGMRLPGSFLGVAEESSLMVDIGEWEIGEAVATMNRWRAVGMTQSMTVH